jgi:hypothetical protein
VPAGKRIDRAPSCSPYDFGEVMRRLRRRKNGRMAALLLRQHGAAFWSVQNGRVTPNGLRDVGTLEADVLQQPIIQSQELTLGLARSSPGLGFGQKATQEQAQKDASRRRRLQNNSRTFHAFTPSGNAKPTAVASHRYVCAQPLFPPSLATVPIGPATPSPYVLFFAQAKRMPHARVINCDSSDR